MDDRMAQDGPGTDAQPDAAETIPSGSGLRTTIILAGFIVLGVLTILYAQGIPPFTRTVQVTEQAEVRGETTIIAPRIDGYVTELLVEDFQRVSAGNILLRLEDSIYAQEVERARGNVQIALAALRNSEQGERAGKAGVSGAQARLEAAQAQLTQAQANMQRIEMLAGQGSISAWERDAAKADLVQSAAAVTEAEARVVAAEQQVEGVTVGRGGLLATVDAARAELRLAEINLANCVIRAPIDGQVSEVGARLGQYVTAGTALMGLVSEQMWVIANFREEQAGRMPAVCHVDGTARVQTVERDAHPLYHDLLAAFEKRTGVPILVNTSFNTRGEPIVCTPRDAVECFWTSPLDALVIGSFLLEKAPS